MWLLLCAFPIIVGCIDINKDRSVNIALETILNFSKDSLDPDSKFIDNIQQFLKHLKTAIHNPDTFTGKEINLNNLRSKLYTRKKRERDQSPEPNTRKRFIYMNFKEFLESFAEILLTYNNQDLDNVFTVLDSEVRKFNYKKCKFRELLSNPFIRRFVIEKLQDLRASTIFMKRVYLTAIVMIIENCTIVENLNKFFKNMRTEFTNFLDDLEQFKEMPTKTIENLTPVIQKGVRSILFDHYSTMNINDRKELKIYLKSLVKSYNNDQGKIFASRKRMIARKTLNKRRNDTKMPGRVFLPKAEVSIESDISQSHEHMSSNITNSIRSKNTTIKTNNDDGSTTPSNSNPAEKKEKDHFKSLRIENKNRDVDQFEKKTIDKSQSKSKTKNLKRVVELEEAMNRINVTTAIRETKTPINSSRKSMTWWKPEELVKLRGKNRRVEFSVGEISNDKMATEFPSDSEVAESKENTPMTRFPKISNIKRLDGKIRVRVKRINKMGHGTKLKHELHSLRRKNLKEKKDIKLTNITTVIAEKNQTHQESEEKPIEKKIICYEIPDSGSLETVKFNETISHGNYCSPSHNRNSIENNTETTITPQKYISSANNRLQYNHELPNRVMLADIKSKRKNYHHDGKSSKRIKYRSFPTVSLYLEYPKTPQNILTKITTKAVTTLPKIFGKATISNLKTLESSVTEIIISHDPNLQPSSENANLKLIHKRDVLRINSKDDILKNNSHESFLKLNNFKSKNNSSETLKPDDQNDTLELMLSSNEDLSKLNTKVAISKLNSVDNFILKENSEDGTVKQNSKHATLNLNLEDATVRQNSKNAVSKFNFVYATSKQNFKVNSKDVTVKKKSTDSIPKINSEDDITIENYKDATPKVNYEDATVKKNYMDAMPKANSEDASLKLNSKDSLPIVTSENAGVQPSVNDANPKQNSKDILNSSNEKATTKANYAISERKANSTGSNITNKLIL